MRSGHPSEIQGSLTEVLKTEELANRPSRSPDFAAENRALSDLAEVVAQSPGMTLQRLVDACCELTGAGSAGISVLRENQGGEPIFRWEATAGVLASLASNTMPRHFSPCGLVIDRNAIQLMVDPVRCWPYIEEIGAPILELLLVPFGPKDKPVGTVWVAAHQPGKHFDAEDARLVTSLSRFAGLGLPMRENPRTDLAERYDQQTRLLDTVLSSISDFAYTFDLQGRFTFINKPLLDLWGLSLEEAVGKNFFDLKYPDALAAKLQQQIQQVIASRQRVVDETEYTSPGGVWGCYQYIFSPILGASGEVEAVAGSTRDITVFKQLEKDRAQLSRAVESERANLAAIIQQAPAFICTLGGPDHIFELANDQYYGLIGRREIIGKPVRIAVPEAADQGFIELLDHVYQTGEAFIGNEMPILISRGADSSALERRFMNFSYQAMRDADGAITGIFVHGVDVTELVQSREAIRESEAAFRQLADAMPQIVFCATPDGHVYYFNQRWYEYTGLPRGEVGIDSWKQIHTPEGFAHAMEAWPRALRTGQPYEIEYPLRRHDGEYRWHLGRALPVRDENGNILRWLGTNTDIHDRKQLEERIGQLLESERLARADAEEASRAKDRFLAVLSHELRTPLSPVVMAVAAMESRSDLPTELRNDVAMIRRNVDLETRLIDDLLDLSRVTSGKMRLHMQPTALHELLRHTSDVCAPDISSKRLNLRFELSARNDRVIGDPGRLQQVFWNLLSNAIKFSPEDSEIVVRTTDAGPGRIRVEVADRGAGIAGDMVGRVFDAFEQGDAGVTRQFGGLGLGLAISKAVIDMHGGIIQAQSPGKGCGATFSVELATSNRVVMSDAIAPSGTGGSPVSQKQRVLLVEDHPDTAKMMARLLSHAGYRVKTAHSVADALRLAAGEPFDVIVSDIGLPDASGYELMRQIRDQYGIKGIALSGYGMEEDVRRGREAGFMGYVVKPVNVAQLDAVIRRVTSGQISLMGE